MLEEINECCVILGLVDYYKAHCSRLLTSLLMTLGKGESILVIKNPSIAVSCLCMWDMITGSAMPSPALVLILPMKQKYKQQKPSSASLKLFAVSCYKIRWMIFKGVFSIHWEKFHFSD